MDRNSQGNEADLTRLSAVDRVSVPVDETVGPAPVLSTSAVGGSAPATAPLELPDTVHLAGWPAGGATPWSPPVAPASSLTGLRFGAERIGPQADPPYIVVSDPTADESQATISFVVSLTGPATQTVTVDYAAVGLTAGANGSDFQNLAGTLTFLAGETSKTVVVTLADSSSVEATEFFKLNLSNPVNANLAESFGLGTIIDNDALTGTPVIQVGDQVVDEKAGTVSFVVTLDRPSTGTVKVDVATAAGTAAAGADFTALGVQTLTFAPGQMAKTVTVALTNDATTEGAEYFDLRLSNAVNGTLTTQPYGRVTIGANDAPTSGTPLISVSDPTADESQALIEFVVSLSAPSAQTVTVNYAAAGITAGANGSDFENTSGTLTFLAGETTKVVKVPLSASSSVEAIEFFKLNLTGAVNATIVEDFGWGTIVDNDAPTGTPVIQVGDQVVDERAGTVSFVVTLDRPSTGTVKVDVATASGTAASGSDFTALSTQTLTFLAGQMAKTVTVALTNDATTEGAETFDLRLSNAVNGTLTTQPYGRVTIGANDAATSGSPLITVSDPTADESQALIEFVVSLSAPSAQTVTVNYAAAGITAGANGSDFENTSGQLIFLAGETTKVVKVPLSASSSVEAIEFFKLNLTGAVNATIVEDFGWGTIIDNDAAAGVPVIQIGDQVVDEKAGTVSFVVTLDRPSTGTVKVDVATASGTAASGSDFTALSTQTLTFLAGQTAKTVTVALTNDATTEGAETFDLRLSNAVNGTLTTQPYGRVTIGANDAATSGSPLITVSDPTADESQALIEFVVSLSAPSAQTVTVNYAAAGITAGANGSDFENTSGQLIFLAGETTKVVKVPLSASSSVEAIEFFKLNLTGAVNATLGETYGLGTLVDNDATAGTPVISVADQLVDEQAGTVSFVVLLDRPSTGSVKVDVSTLSGSAVAGADFTALSTQTLTFLAGQTAKTVTVSLVNDTTAEAGEFFDLRLSNAVNGTIADAGGRLFVSASDAAASANPYVSVSDPTADEAQAAIEFVVSLSAPSTQTVTVDYGTAGLTAGANGSDFENTSGQLIFLAGETTKVVKVPLSASSSIEALEFFKLNLSGAVNATLVEPYGLGTIIDNDAATGTPALSVSDAVFDEANGLATFTVRLDRPSTGQVKVDASTFSATAVSVSDYDFAGTQTLVFAAGEMSKTVTVNLRADTLAEGPEFFDLALSNAVNATVADGRGHAILPRSDAATSANPSIAASVIAADEAGAYIEFGVTLSAPSTQLVTVNYATANGTAINNTDFQGLSGTLTFAPGQVHQIVRIPVYEDTGVEGNETFLLNLSGAVNGTIATASVSATILDNDDTSTTPFANVGTGNGDILIGRPGANSVSGGNGDDLLDGLAGVQMTGGAGNDTFIVETSTDVVAEASGGGTDTVVSYLSAYTLGANVERGVLGHSGVNLTGNSLANTLIGNGGANRLDGSTGADAMTGGSGNDTYVVDNAADTTVEAAGGGADAVESSISWTLAAEVEKLTLTGTGATSATGNSLANTLIGNTGANTLRGGQGADSVTGGLGADSFVFSSTVGSDTVTDFKAVDDTFSFSMAGIRIGDGDTVVEGAATRAAPGGFATSAELVVFTTNIAGALTTASAAAAIGSATGAYAIGADVLFAVDNGTQTGLFLFQSAGADATVSAAELTQLGLVSGDASSTTDYVFIG